MHHKPSASVESQALRDINLSAFTPEQMEKLRIDTKNRN